MGDHFQGSDHVELQPGDRNFPIKMKFNAASASTSNDGSMPYGSTVSSAILTVKSRKGIDATTSILSSSIGLISNNSVIAYVNHSSDVSDGAYTLTSKVSFSLLGSTCVFTKEFDLRRIILRDE